MALAADNIMPVDKAYTALRQNGKLADMIIKEPFDLSKVAIVASDPTVARPAYVFENVIFKSGLTTGRRTINAYLRFVDCQFETIEAEGTTWLADVHFEYGHITHSADFENNEFRSDIRFHYVNFDDEAWFTHSRFSSTAEFLHCIWNYKARFSDTTFAKAAKFNFSTVRERAVFQATVFENDVSFIKFNHQDKKGDSLKADFLNVIFKGDAEFRFCKFNQVQFSKSEYISIFYKLADFRASNMSFARFDYAEFRGLANFVKAKFGDGGVSFENAGIRGPSMILDSVNCDGPMILSGPYIPNLRFRWSEIGPAVLMAKPSSDDLELLWNRELALGRSREALKLEYYKSKLADKKVWVDPKAKPVERAWAMLRWIAWGWPTGYGTRFGRILLITGICWLICAIFSLSRRDLFIAVPPVKRFKKKDQNDEGTLRRYCPVNLEHLPIGAAVPISTARQLGLAFSFTFGLMFKVGGGNVAYLEPLGSAGRHRFKSYFMVVWFLGSVLLALMAFTLAKTNPVLQKIIGEVIF